MARPIEPTPQLDAEDSERLLDALEKGCSPSEAARRMTWAEQQIEAMMRPHPGIGDRARRR